MKIKCPKPEVQRLYLLSAVVWLLLPFCLPGIPVPLYAADITTIRFLESAEIDTDRIRLGGIAEIKGEDQEMVQKLRAIVIGQAPLPGESTHINEEYVKTRLKQNSVDLSQIRIEGSRNIKISSGFVEICKEKIKQVAMDFIYKKIPWEKNRVRIKEIRVSDNVVLPRGKIAYEVIPPLKTDYLGATPLSILFKVNGDLKKRVWATVDIEVLSEVVVTKRPLRRYQLITEDDIQLEKTNLADLSSDAVTSLDEVLGKRTRRRIDTHVVLRANLIELPPLVNRGDVVLMVAESGALRITALGEVKGKGRQGERIRVVNLDSNQVVYARVLDSNTVAVDY
jgi:flagella basal body P-ring formation protein FlgA